MSKRFKNIEVCIDWEDDGYGRLECRKYETKQVPIQEWFVYPNNINLPPYKQGAEIPTGHRIAVHFPELDLWNECPYDDVKFKIRGEYSGTSVEWLNFSIIGDSPTLDTDGVFSPNNLSSANIGVSFKNFRQLPVGTYSASIYLEAFGIDNSGEHYIEHYQPPIQVSLEVQEGDGEVPPTDNDTRYLTYNKSTKELSGDTIIDTATFFDDIQIEPWLSANRSGDKQITLSANDITNSLNIGTYKGLLIVRDRGFFSIKRFSYPIELKVIENRSFDFEVTPDVFNFIVAKNNNEVKTGISSISNPNQLPIEIPLKPQFIETANIENGNLVFTTKNSQQLQVGNYSGDIVLQSGDIIKKIRVYLRVAEGIKSDFNGKPYYFALDKHKVTLTKTNPRASYAKVRLDMHYRAYGEEYRESQEYSYTYLKNEIIFYPGDDVQDFFIRCKNLQPLSEVGYQMGLSPVKISIKEYDVDDKELSVLTLNHILFAPGKTPKCFPIWTDFPTRSVYEQSVVRLNTTASPNNTEIDRLYSVYNEPKPNYDSSFEVFAYNLERSKFNVATKEVLSTEKLTFIPLPSVDKAIHIFFENQNLVLDWFTCPGECQKNYDFKHIFDESGNVKYGSLETENIILNTGWILKEEIELINAIIKSRICFIVIDGNTIIAKPTSKKNEIFDTVSSKFNMDIEFNIKTDAR
ncbi:hypothetical protein [Riemerella anatipestifer]|uniref:hypothetical protein n=1 Tax=Riemerella anatipestifer TaxID=34085 RepID=UPI00208F6E87|nr:hypothetical protein [Riemerella anatipestifer]MCO4303705.1 hypothetical protein [Riemerella anatipestifer]MCO7352112.1 hypothetical protein [Riemerella anatipestifer]MCT6760625.1 hypothetical protein [Riemerella anatipestifer]MCT6764303.1 hypothetical protein [Riemerella anatipestifer]MCT6766340.1 hypothetical protein [Riemerella anatipestifer]